MTLRYTQVGTIDLESYFGLVQVTEDLGKLDGVGISAHGIPFPIHGADDVPMGGSVITVGGTYYAPTQAAMDTLDLAMRSLHRTRTTIRRDTVAETGAQTAQCVAYYQPADRKALQVTAFLRCHLLEDFRGTRRGETPVYGTADWDDGWIYGGDTRSGSIGSAVTLANDGNADVNDAEITITVSSGSFTDFTISDGVNNSLSLVLSVTSADVIVIDCEARTVTKNGTLQSVVLGRASAHTHGDWLRIPSGGCDVTISGTGGGTGTHAYKYREAWR
jgi:hypothetical protein